LDGRQLIRRAQSQAPVTNHQSEPHLQGSFRRKGIA
jgi:hypothetical protein